MNALTIPVADASKSMGHDTVPALDTMVRDIIPSANPPPTSSQGARRLASSMRTISVTTRTKIKATAPPSGKKITSR